MIVLDELHTVHFGLKQQRLRTIFAMMKDFFKQNNTITTKELPEQVFIGDCFKLILLK